MPAWLTTALVVVGAIIGFILLGNGLYWAFIGLIKLVFLIFGIKRPIRTWARTPRYGKPTEADRREEEYYDRRAWAGIFFKEALKADLRRKKILKKTAQALLDDHLQRDRLARRFERK